MTDRIGRLESLLPINHNRCKSEKINAFFFGERAFEYQMSKIRENITGGYTA